MAVLPFEADAILAVDPDAVLPASVSVQPLEPVSGWDRQMLNVSRVIDLVELATGHRPQREWAGGTRNAGTAAVEDVLCSLVGKRGYYALRYNA